MGLNVFANAAVLNPVSVIAAHPVLVIVGVEMHPPTQSPVCPIQNPLMLNTPPRRRPKTMIMWIIPCGFTLKSPADR